MITAKEAYAIAKPKIDEYMNYLEEQIKEAAYNKQTSTIIRKLPYGEWILDEEKLDDDAKKAIHSLRSRGFVVSLFYEERQLVDMGLRISWEQPQC